MKTLFPEMCLIQMYLPLRKVQASSEGKEKITFEWKQQPDTRPLKT